jgi:hypothetical protein
VFQHLPPTIIAWLSRGVKRKKLLNVLKHWQRTYQPKQQDDAD